MQNRQKNAYIRYYIRHKQNFQKDSNLNKKSFVQQQMTSLSYTESRNLPEIQNRSILNSV